MSDNKEKISAYLDDDLDAGEFDSLVGGLSGDDAMRAASRYQLMGDAIRGEISDASLVDVSEQVSKALRDINPGTVESPVRPASPETGSSGFDFGAWFAPFVKPLGGLAVAASVALVTVIAVTRVDSVSEPAGQLAEADSQKVNIPVTAVATRTDTKPAVAAVAVSNRVNPSRAAAYLDTYLAEHAEFAAQDTMQGRMPYARAVSYESK